jgi:hypothetical protein
LFQGVAEWLVGFVAIYAAIGLAFAVAFVRWGVDRIDPVARASGWGFRLAILPGAAALWPLLAARLARGGPPPVERNAHRDAARDRP